MHNDFRHHPRKEETKQAESESETCPIMPVLHDFQGITFEIHNSFEIHFVKCLHRNLVLSPVPHAIFLIVEMEIMIYRLAWISDLLVFPGRDD